MATLPTIEVRAAAVVARGAARWSVACIAALLAAFVQAPDAGAADRFACVSNADGSYRRVDRGTVCRRGERRLAWKVGEIFACASPELRELADSLDHPLYWAGPPRGSTLELTRTPGGNVFVRYLPAGTSVGDRRPRFTTVATYPQPRAYANAVTASKRPGSARATAPGGGIVVWNRRRPTSVYVAQPGTGVLVEVYDPSAARARMLVLSGEIGPVR